MSSRLVKKAYTLGLGKGDAWFPSNPGDRGDQLRVSEPSTHPGRKVTEKRVVEDVKDGDQQQVR